MKLFFSIVLLDKTVPIHLVHLQEHIFVKNYFNKYHFYPLCRTNKNMFYILSSIKLSEQEIELLLKPTPAVLSICKNEIRLEYEAKLFISSS